MSKDKPSNFRKRFDIIGCFIDYEGKFLLLHRHPHKTNGSMWGLPAGKKEHDENLKQGVSREVAEETGLVLTEPSVTYFDSLYVSDGSFDIEWHIFSTRLTELPLISISPSEHSAYRWVSPDEALGMPLIHDLPESIKLFYERSGM